MIYHYHSCYHYCFQHEELNNNFIAGQSNYHKTPEDVLNMIIFCMAEKNKKKGQQETTMALEDGKGESSFAQNHNMPTCSKCGG